VSTVEEIEKAVQNLSPEQLAAFRVWFAEFDAELWERKIERDAAAGRLDSLITEAREEHQHGRTTEL
jgi:hypothetical protein